MNYTVIKNESYTNIIRTNSDGSVTIIPADESNSDYQRYLRWLENPNTEERGGLN